MVRASALAVVFGVTAGTLGGTGSWLPPAAAAQGVEDPAPSVSDLLRKGIDEYRWGNYDEAHRAFEQAAKQPNLTERDHELLNRYRPRVNLARQSRQEATESLENARQAINVGDYKQAEKLAQAAAENNYVSADVREEAKLLLARAQAANSGAAPAKPDRDEPRRRQAQQLLAQARKQLRDGNVDEAERLAHQAEALKLSYNRFEDSPAKLSRDVADARKGKSVSGGVSVADDTKKARALVAGAESKLQHNEFDQAEALAQQAKGLNVKFSWFEKTPDDILAEVQKVRRRQSSPVAGAEQSQKTPGTPSTGAEVTKTPPESGELEAVPSSTEAAESDQTGPSQQGSRGQQPTISNQSRRAGTISDQPSSNTTHQGGAAPGSRAAREEALELLRQGRAQLREGNLDEAYRLAQLARDKKANYGLLDDTPARLAEDVGHARARMKSAPPAGSEDVASAQPPPELAAVPMNRPPGKDKDVRRQAANLLKKAREYMARGDYDTAIEIAQRVNGWNLDYSVWDDTPGRVDSAARAMRSGVVARSARGQAQQQAQQEKAIADNLLSDARRDLKQGRLDEAELKAHQAQEMRVPYSLLADRPEAVLDDITKARRRQLESAIAAQKAEARKAAAQAAASSRETTPSPSNETPAVPAETAALPTTAPEESGAPAEVTLPDAQKKAQARQLVWQARKLMDAGQLDEAEQLVAQAESYQMNWALWGDSPEKLRRDLVRARTRSSAGQGGDDKAIAESLVAEARRDLKQGRLDEAEHKAQQAQQLRVTFSMFADRPERVLDDVARLRRKSGPNSGRIASEASAVASAPGGASTENEMTPVEQPAETQAMPGTSVADTQPEPRNDPTPTRTVESGLPARVAEELTPVGTRPLPPRAKAQPVSEQVAKSTPSRPIGSGAAEVQPRRMDSNDSALQSIEPATPANPPAATMGQRTRPARVDEELTQVRSEPLTARPKMNRTEQRPATGSPEGQSPAAQDSTPAPEGTPSASAAQANGAETVAPAQGVSPTAAEDFASLSPAQKQTRGRELVVQARKQIETGQLDEAEQSIVQAESLRLKWGYFEDSPATLRRALTAARSNKAEISRARQREGSGSERIAAQPAAAPPVEKRAAMPPQVVQELSGVKSEVLTPRENRQQPKQQPAQTMPATTPEVAQVNVESSASIGMPEVVTAASPQAPQPVAEDASSLTPDQKKTQARKLVAQARKLIDTGYLEEAEQCIVQAEVMQVKWRGLFGDSPESLRRDLARARTQKDKAVALSLLAEARTALQQGRLDEAEHKARQAQQLPMTYGRWSDRPDLVLADISRAREGQAERITPQPGESTQVAGGPVRPASMTESAMPSGTATSGSSTDGEMVRIVQPTAAPSAADIAGMPSESTPPAEAIEYLSGAKSNNLTSHARPRTAVKLDAGVQPTEVSQQPVEPANLTSRPGPIIHLPDPVEQKAAELMARGDFEGAQQVLRANGRMSTPETAADPQGQRLENARRLFQAGNYPRAKELALEVQAASPTLRPQADDLIARISVMEQSMVLQLYEAGEAAARKGEYTRALGFFKQVDASGVPLDPITEHQLRSYLRDLPGRAAQARASAAPASVTVANGRVQTTPSLQEGPTSGGLESAAQRQRVQFQQLVSETNQKVQSAKRLLSSDPGQAIKDLELAREHVRSSGLDDSMTGPLVRRVDTAIQFASQAKERFDADRVQRQSDEAAKAMRQRELAVEQQKHQEMQKLIEKAQVFMKEGRFAEAEEVAKQATEIDPDNPAAAGLQFKARIAHQDHIQKEIKEKSAAAFVDSMTNVDRTAVPYGDDRVPIRFSDAKNWGELSERRFKQVGRLEAGQKTEKELEIERKLSQPISVNFTETPLAEVIAFLRDLTTVNMWLDDHALQTDGISSDRPISMKLDDIQLKNVLKLMLGQMDLTYMVENEALVITTPVKSQGKMYFNTYQVGDLVIPVPNFTGNHLNMVGSKYGPPGMGGGPNPGGNRLGLGGGGPFQSVGLGQANNALGGNAPLGTGTNGLGQFGAGLGGTQPLGSAPGNTTGSRSSRFGTGYGAGNTPAGQQVDFDSLINLIQQTIAPSTWSSVGGSGTVEPFQANLSLVVNQTQAVHEQIADLLAQLRRLQDLQVAVEVKFISLTENFFERIGIDFDMQLQSNQQRPLRHFGSTLTPEAGNIPAVNRNIYLDHEDDFAVGVNQQNAIFQDVRGFTPDLKIPFRTGNFGKGRPASFATGDGLSFGIAFLSDLEVSLFLEAAQQNNRGNVLSAPKVTLFNGAFAFVFSGTIEPFVTELTPVISAGAVSFEPTIDQFLNGAGLIVQAVISADRRYVRLNLIPIFNQIARIETFIVPAAAGGGGGVLGGGSGVAINGELRIPVIATNIVTTTVTVPDGGTVLMGGVKTKTERRNEAGVPILSKIPYINRLFTDTGTESLTSSLLIMATPRIIILEEEEELLGKATIAF